MACSTTHSTKTQGAGLCCAQVQSGALTAAPGATFAPYTAGYNWATNPNNFPHVQVTDSSGHCGTCAIVGSRGRKHPGKAVLHFQRGGPGCPSSMTGCCAMANL